MVGVQALEWSVSGCLCCVHCSFCTRWNDLSTTELCPQRDSCLIFMLLRCTPDWIRRHLSLKSADSLSRSSRGISGLTTYGRDKLLRLERILVASEMRMNLTSIGLGRELLGENFPSLWQSLTEFGSIALLMLDSTLTASLKSDSKRDIFDRPEGHSSTSYNTTLNFLSELANTLGDLSPTRGCSGVFAA